MSKGRTSRAPAGSIMFLPFAPQALNLIPDECQSQMGRHLMSRGAMCRTGDERALNVL